LNPTRLLEHFERIAEAPDAIPRLRRFILDLAVRGKLVEQDPNDEPASELLRKIQAEKLKLLREGIIKKVYPLKTVSGSQIKFSVPNNWQWVRLIDVVKKLTDGSHHSPPNGPDGDFKYVTAKNIKENGVLLDNISYVSIDVHEEIFSRCNPEYGDLLYIKDGATTGIVTINNLDEPFSMLSSVALLKTSSYIYNRLLLFFLRSSFFYDQMRDNMKGAAIARVTLKRMEPAYLPLPPIEEQHRIVVKVDELMALCARLEATQAKRESRRDRLASASLKRIGQPEEVGNGEKFQENVRFHLYHLPRLTTRSEHIKELRQTILNLAVRGKLVEQDQKENPPKDCSCSISKSNEIPFEIPTNWCWATLQTLGSLKGGGTPSKSNNDFWSGDIPWIAPKDMKVDYVKKSDFLISNDAINSSAVKIIKIGSILFVVRGMILAHSFPVAVSVGRLTINQDMKALELKYNEFNEYILRAFKGLKPFFLSKVQRSSHGTCRLVAEDYCSVLIPLPPLPEQRRIVARVDELLGLCDQLESQLSNAQVKRARLLEATIYEALGGSSTPSAIVNRPMLSDVQAKTQPSASPLHAFSPRIPRETKTTAQGDLIERPKQTPVPPAKDAPEAILAHMRPGQEYSRAQLCDVLGLSVYEWNMAIRELKDSGKVVQTGEKRGARYRLVL
jgi:type I restriction enzyme S subunit